MPYNLSNAKILIIDDMQPMLMLCSSILEIFGFKKVYTAQSADEGLDMVMRIDPDLIIVDWMMEPKNGMEFVQEIRRNKASPNQFVPIIMMTGFSSKPRVEQARDSGITEFLVKPFNSRDLYNRIVQIIEKPRQFVDTGEFFGPDRRRRMAPDYQGPKKRENDNNSSVEDSGDSILKKLREEAKNLKT